MFCGRIRTPLFSFLLLAAGLQVARAAPPASPAATDSKAGFGESFRPPAGALVAPGKAADFTLLYTGDALGFIDPCG